MALEFEPIRMDRQQAYLRRLCLCPQTASDYSFINLWAWAEAHGLEWAWTKNLVWIRQTEPETLFWAPVGDWKAVDWKTEFSTHAGDSAVMIRVPEKLASIWQSGMPGLDVREARGHWDYIYAVEELVNLRGNRFHKKKNLYNQFAKKYDHAYHELGPEMIGMAKDMQRDWCTWRDCEAVETLAAENGSIEKILDSWMALTGILGGALTVDGRMVAYTIAERSSADTLLIHFEKADPGYKGAYQAINRLFLEHAGGGAMRVNREQDLDEPGLRKAKLSYHPLGFLRKYEVRMV